MDRIYADVWYGQLIPDVKNTVFLRVLMMWVFIRVMIYGNHTTPKVEWGKTLKYLLHEATSQFLQKILKRLHRKIAKLYYST